MPPKAGKKRSRESTGTSTTTPASPAAGTASAPAAAAAAAVPPSSAPPALRRTGSNSAASQEEGGESGGEGSGDASRVTKRSRRSGSADPVTDSGNDGGDVDMGDATAGVAGQAGANGGGQGAATAGATAAAAAGAKKGGGRRKSTSAAASNGESSTAAAATTTSQPASKRGRKSTPSATAAAPSAPAHRAPIANGSSGGANGLPTAAAVPGTGGRPPLAAAPASRTTPAGARGSGAGAGARGRGAAVPAATSDANRGGSSRANSNSVSGSRTSFGAAVAAEQAKVRAQADARAGAAVQARARAQQQQQQQQLASPSRAASSPVPAARLRRVTGPQSSNGGDDDESGGDGDGDDKGSGSGGLSAGAAAAAPEGFVGRGWRAVVSRGKGAWGVVIRKCHGDSADVEMSSAPPVAKRWTLKCLGLLTYLVVACVIWAGTLRVAAGVAGSRSTSNGGGGGGGGGGGVTRRQEASSIVRQSKDFRSLKELLAERRRHLAEIEEQEQKEHGTLESLRVFVQRLDDQVELLREQAAGGVASRGTPDDHKASEEVSLSQLEEVRAMQDNLTAQREATSEAVEEGEKWTRAAAEEFEALAAASHSTSSNRLSPKEKAESNQDVEDTWRSEFATPLEKAFLALEQVHNTVDAIDDLGASKPGSKERSAFVRVVEEAKAPDAVGDDGRLEERVESVALREVSKKWAVGEPGDSGGQGNEGSAGPGPREILKDGEEAQELVAREVEMFSTGGTGMPDHASLGLGGSVVYGALVLPEEENPVNTDAGVEEGQLTSPTLASSTLPWADYLLHVLRVPGRVFAEGADAALSSANSLGSCFAFLGGEGRLTVKLARPPVPLSAAGSPALGSSSSSLSAPSGGANGGVDRDGFIRVTHVSIEHARTASAPTAQKSAPRSFRVLGWDEDPGGLVTTTASSLLSSITGGLGSGGGEGRGGKAAKANGKGDSEVKAEPPRPHVLLEGAEYEAGGGARGVQTFAVPEGVREATPPVGWVTLEVQSNHGGKWTCLYGFRVHGDRVG